MAKKDIIERIKECMKDPSRVRNIATSSHVHHGKCVSKDTLIFLLNETLTAKDLFDKLKKDSNLIKKNEYEEIYELKKDIRILSFKNGTITTTLLTHIWKMRNDDKMMEVELKDGRRIKVTKEHKFLVLDKEKIKEIETHRLKIGDKIIVPTFIPNNSLSLKKLKEFILKGLEKDKRFFVKLKEKFGRKFYKKIMKIGKRKIWKEINSNLSFSLFYNNIKEGKYNLSDILKIAETFGIELKKLYENIETLIYKNKESSENRIKLPNNEEEIQKFFYLLGSLFECKNLNLDLDKKNKIKVLCKKIFNINFDIKKERDILKRFFEVLFNIEKNKNLKLPLILFNLPLNYSSCFIKGYFDFHKKSKNKVLLEQIQLLLLRFGLLSYIKEKRMKVKKRLFKKFILNILNKEDLEKISYNLPKDEFKEFYSFFLKRIFTYPLISISFSSIIPIEVAKIREIKKEKWVYDFTAKDTHNFLANGMFIHNTTLTDNLMAGAGMIAEEMAGEVMFTWFDPQERKRELTIYGANVSMVHEYEGKDFLINLLDTPGHVDFGGDVTRAMRAVDGTIVLVDAVDGVMPQTETVFRQALRERVKPVLFINKVDRLIRELKLSPQEMQERFEEIIRDVNLLIQKYAEEEYRKEWIVNVQDGSVAFGSAFKRWAISIPFMKKTNITFKDIIELTLRGEEDELSKKAPLHKVILDMVIKHLPSPIQAQKYRLSKIWKGNLEDEIGKAMLNCDVNGRFAAIVTKMIPDPHVGFVATARIFSGRCFKGKDVYLISSRKKEKIQNVAIFKGIQRINVDEVTAGNIAAIVGIPTAFTGETICDADFIIQPFEEIKHLFEPVVTKSIEPKRPADLARLINELKRIAREDPTIKVSINQETGEYLVSGLGELHLEAKVENKIREAGIEVNMSEPIVVYRETVFGKSDSIEGKSPNKHNKFYIIVEKLEEDVYNAMIKEEIPDNLEIKTKNVQLAKKISSLGMPYDEAKNIILIYNKNVFIDMTKGVQFLNEVIENVKIGFKNVCDSGPLAWEPCVKLKVKLIDAELHEDAVHRGPGQIIPAIRYAIRKGILSNDCSLLEPKQVIRIDTPSDLIGSVTKEVENRRGQILNMEEERGVSIITAKIPVSEIFGFDSSLKSATGGRGFYSLIDIVFEKIPSELRNKTIISIRKRKGLKEEVPKDIED